MQISNVSSAVTNNVAYNQNNNNNVAFKGNFLQNSKKALCDFVDLKKDGTMARNLFVVNAFVFLLASRLITSRDKDEKREILIRDVPSIGLAVCGVPMFQNMVAKVMQNKSGFAFLKNPKEKMSETVSYGQLEDWYKFDKNLKTGFQGFCQRLEERGGNLAKIFSTLGDDMKAKVQEFGKGLDNKQLQAKLFDKSEASEKLKKELIGAFSGDNKALKQASFLKTMSAVAGYASTLVILGLCIPKLNIAITEKINKDKKANEAKANDAKAETVASK